MFRQGEVVKLYMAMIRLYISWHTWIAYLNLKDGSSILNKHSLNSCVLLIFVDFFKYLYFFSLTYDLFLLSQTIQWTFVILSISLAAFMVWNQNKQRPIPMCKIPKFRKKRVTPAGDDETEMKDRRRRSRGKSMGNISTASNGKFLIKCTF